VNVAKLTRSLALLVSLTLIAACGGGGGGSKGNAAAQGSNFDSGCTGSCATNSPANLTVADVQKVISQAVQEAQVRGQTATIAVTDRVGNVLAIFRMTGALTTFTIRSTLVDAPSISGLENINVLPSTYAAIAKAVTGSYLASEGNAFSTRTASHIIQEHFSPHETGLPGGPLFGVQFSQLPCGDLVTDGAGAAINIGPHRSPLGLSADPGGFPLYKNGHPVGGIGVIADDVYGLDRNILDTDSSVDELIAIAGQFGFAPPVDRQANRITVDGRSLRYSDVDSGDLVSNPQVAPAFGTTLTLGALVSDTVSNNYFNSAGGVLAGTTFGTGASGIVDADNIDATFAGLDAFILSNAAGTVNRYPPRNAVIAVGGDELTAADVTQLLRSALGVANQARAQIRRPLNSQARVTISIVDTGGNILGIVRTRDAPIFGTDVSLQKARTATFFSSTDAGTVLSAQNDVTYLNANGTASGTVVDFSVDYVGSVASGKGVRAFLGTDMALANGTAFADRSGGNLSRPFYPDGNDLVALPNNGPLSKPFVTTVASNSWSPFSNGLQLDLVLNELVDHLVNGTNNTSCTGTPRLANGIQIFPGSVPIYRNGVLIGGIGVSGDGVDQDDMISFLGTNRASVALGKANGIGDGAIIGNAPTGIRADNITPTNFPGQALRYIQCPQNPFIGSSANNVCDGL